MYITPPVNSHYPNFSKKPSAISYCSHYLILSKNPINLHYPTFSKNPFPIDPHYPTFSKNPFAIDLQFYLVIHSPFLILKIPSPLILKIQSSPQIYLPMIIFIILYFPQIHYPHYPTYPIFPKINPINSHYSNFSKNPFSSLFNLF